MQLSFCSTRASFMVPPHPHGVQQRPKPPPFFLLLGNMSADGMQNTPAQPIASCKISISAYVAVGILLYGPRIAYRLCQHRRIWSNFSFDPRPCSRKPTAWFGIDDQLDNAEWIAQLWRKRTGSGHDLNTPSPKNPKRKPPAQMG